MTKMRDADFVVEKVELFGRLVLAAGAGVAGNAEILGAGAAIGAGEAFRGQAPLEQFTNCCSPAGHAAAKAPAVQRFQSPPW